MILYDFLEPICVDFCDSVFQNIFDRHSFDQITWTFVHTYLYQYISCLLPFDYNIEYCISISYLTMHLCICTILIFILCLYHNDMYFYLIVCLCRCFSTFRLMQQPLVFMHDKLLFHFRYLRTKTYCLLLMILHLRTYV